MIQLLRATNGAAKYNMGVGGYFNIVLFDGKEDDPDKRFVEIFDSRSKLASEIVLAFYHDFISYDVSYELIDELIFKNSKSFKTSIHVLSMHQTTNQKWEDSFAGIKFNDSINSKTKFIQKYIN